MFGYTGKHSARLILVLFATAVAVAAGVEESYYGQGQSLETSKWQGFDCFSYEMDGCACTLVKPDARADGAPWLFRANAPNPESALDKMLLEKGFHIAWMDVEALYGNSIAVERWSAFYAWATDTLGLAAKPALAGEGHGALLLYNWAAQHSDTVACIYAELPWLRLVGGDGPGLKQDEALTQKVAEAHGVADAEEYDGTPLGRAAAVGGATIPVMHIYGARQPGVAPDKSIEQFYAAYRLAGRGEYESIAMPPANAGSRHDIATAALVFLLKHTGQLPGMTMDMPIASMPQWKVADFAGRSEVRVLDDILIIEQGNDMTGVVYAGEPARLNYEIVLDAMRLSGGDFFCGLTAPYKDTSFSLVVGGWGGTCVGISSLDWLDAYHNETARFRSFDDQRWYRIRLRVTEDAIQAWIDGEETVNVAVADREVDIRWEMAPTKPLGIATWRTTGAIKNFSVRPIAETTDRGQATTDDTQ